MKKSLILSLILLLAGAGLLVSVSCSTNPTGPNFSGAVQTVVANNPTLTATNTRTCMPSRTPTPLGSLTPTQTSTPTTTPTNWTPAPTATPTQTPLCPF